MNERKPLVDKDLARFDEDGRQIVFPIAPFGASETREERLARWEASGTYDPDCAGCVKYVRDHPTLSPFYPSHNARPTCGSGGRPHCICPRCWG